MKIEDNIQICLFYEGGVPKQSTSPLVFFFRGKQIRTGYNFYNKKVITGIHLFLFSLQLEKEKNNEFDELIA